MNPFYNSNTYKGFTLVDVSMEDFIRVTAVDSNNNVVGSLGNTIEKALDDLVQSIEEYIEVFS